ncbi:carboxypeptidase regulatory-like domain-containing protein [Reinekea sp.]|uniref:carboxypeptidase regulatory-like domain-containing protein n=1 Tax=Reinekea sp. TaxID=1970455 RepID=UPI00398A4B86
MTPKKIFAKLSRLSLLMLMSIPTLVFSATEVDNGLSWLEQQIDGVGFYATTNELVSPIDSTYATMVSLDNNLKPLESSSIQIFVDTSASDTINLANAISIKIRAGLDVSEQVNTVLQRQNYDGGFGSGPNSESTVIDTAHAVTALLVSGNIDNNALNQGLSFLISMQGSDGAWRYSDGIPSVYLTASVTKTLWMARGLTQQDATTAVFQARQYILSQVNGSTGLWSDIATSATAINAIFPTYPDPLTMTPYLSRLKQQQSSDGSWAGKVYETALAIQALNADAADAILSTVPTVILGNIVDRDSSVSIQSFNAILESALNTYNLDGTDGDFIFNNIEGGSYNLVVSAEGYEQKIVSDITVVPNTTRTLAVVQMSAVPTSAILLGKVLDSTSNAAISGAKVTISGAHNTEVLTDANGYYQIPNIVPGALSIRVNREGYQVVSAQAEAVAGRTLSFNPSLKPNSNPGADPLAGTPSTSSVLFNVVDVHGDPVKYAAVRGDFSGNSESIYLSTGGYGHVSKVFDVKGNLTFTVSKVGYNVVASQVSIVMGHNFNLNVVLQPAGADEVGTVDDSHEPQENLPTNSEFIITVLDRNSGSPIEGSSVSVSGSQSLSSITNATGLVAFYQFGTETVHISVERDGYLTESGNVELFAGNRSALQVELLQDDAVDTRTSTLTALLLSESTQQPVLGATAELVDSLDAPLYVWSSASEHEILLDGLIPGTYNLNISAPDYFDFVRPIQVTPGSNVALGDILLEEQLPSPKLFGRIIDSTTLAPLSGALIASQVSQQTAITDEYGHYVLENLALGEQSIIVAASGYARQSHLIQLDRPIAHQFDVGLALSTGVGVSIDRSDLEFLEFGAYQEVIENVVLVNNTATDKFVHLEFNLFNQDNEMMIYTRGLDEAGNVVQATGIKVPANSSVTSQLRWESQNLLADTYQAAYRLLTANSGVGPNSLVLHEVFKDVVIEATHNIQTSNLLHVGNTLDVGELTLFEPTIELTNGSNTDGNLTVYYQIINPSGSIIAKSELLRDEWHPNTQNLTLDLPPMEVLILSEGSHQLEVVSTLYGTQHKVMSEPLLASPSIRIDVTQSLSDDLVYPNQEKAITVNIQLEGKEYFGE